MELEVDDMKVLGAIVGGGKTIKHIKQTSRLDKKEIEKILEFLDRSELISAIEGKGIWGQTQFYFAPTDDGSKKAVSYTHLTLPTIYSV